MKKRYPLIWLTCTLFILTACQPIVTAPAPDMSATEVATLVLATHDSFNVSEDVITHFEEANSVTVQVLALGDAGEALNKIILSKDAPLADLFFGVDNTFLSRALEADIFESYTSPQLAQVPPELQLDPEGRLLPVDYGFVNINADKEWFAEQNLPIPQTLEELVQPEYANLLAVQNPASSSPGLAFLLTTIGHFGEEGYLEYWQALRDNGVLIADDWSSAYFEHFTVGSAGGGDRPLVVSYSSSPPADVLFATDGRTEPASVNVSPDDGVFRQVEFVGLLKGAQQPELARKFIDFMLDTSFQEDIPLQMFVYPANQNAQLPELFEAFAEAPSQPVDVAPAAIDANREQWTEAWTDLMLR